MTTATQAAAKGAALLDEEIPGWADRIDLPTLDLGSCTRCVLGQLFSSGRSGWEAPYALGLHHLSLSVREAVGHGFTTNSAEVTWPQLGEAWADEVLRRQRVPA